jgi:hypothetical protein
MDSAGSGRCKPLHFMSNETSVTKVWKTSPKAAKSLILVRFYDHIFPPCVQPVSGTVFFNF